MSFDLDVRPSHMQADAQIPLKMIINVFILSDLLFTYSLEL